MKLSIVIPHHNGKKLIFECLESLFSNTSIQNFETIVVDNLSTIENSSKSSITFLSNNKYASLLASSNAAAVIVNNDF